MVTADKYEQRRFWILVLIVSISGFSQGMLLPLISVIFETDGVSSTLNGLNATGLYIGTLLISPFIEQPLRRFGYKPIIIVGGAVVFTALLMFPLWQNVMFWFVLRLLIGVGDHCLHYSTQTWLTSTAKQGNIGKSMAIYGLAFGVGFAVGPLMVPMVKVSQSLPFIVSSALCLFAWLFVFFIRNEKPEVLKGDSKETNSFSRYKLSFKYAWVAFLPPFVYGILETSLNALFPVYALRKDFDVSMVSIILASFSIGAIVTQIPIGILGDKIGRRKVILIGMLVGAILFAVGSQFEHSEILVLATFLVSGMFLGSLFSLGITYMADLTPKELLPTGNLLCGIFFSLGSLFGPFIGGLYLQLVDTVSFLLFISIMLFIIYFIILLLGNKRLEAR
ncbi:predicted MFS family arabinose efflux permease [Ureibacillus xyleni]|uniref:Predicted MFS family arabinose efflux permease n=1 Tax=Ureibacillus xyleni TaxID=614648 RepID=A0A285S027_9BACL|nr:MFS transporter [Ureibacillus xyleni]SOC00057.1 predicted MFS family arabinose efflux permease [Ureibacillus xyleni]